MIFKKATYNFYPVLELLFFCQTTNRDLFSHFIPDNLQKIKNN